MGRELEGLIREERELRLAMFLAADEFEGARLDYDEVVQRGSRKVRELAYMRQRWAGQIADGRYSDMAYRIAANDALQKYRQQFDLAQLYTYLTAIAYDYETNLSGEDRAEAEKMIRQIVAERSLGELRWNTGALGPRPDRRVGRAGGPVGRMRDNFRVLKAQMGFNNPQAEANRFSLRHELFRLRDEPDATWQQTLVRYYKPDIYADPVVAKLAQKPQGATGPQPGLIIPMPATVTEGLNFFGKPLGEGDSAYDASQFPPRSQRSASRLRDTKLIG